MSHTSVVVGAGSLSTAIGRWSGLGPYFAMFPVEFAFKVIEGYSKPGDAVLDPFAGRASSIYAAAALERSGCGVEINPVGWLYGHVKLRPATEARVLQRIQTLGDISIGTEQSKLDALPKFFHACYAPGVLRYLLSARDNLRWKTSIVDGTVMAIILVYLHAKKGEGLSNQLRQGKAMSPDYCVKWWEEHGYEAPDIDPVAFLTKRVKWRYYRGKPELRTGKVMLGDSTSVITRLQKQVSQGIQKPYSLLFTSPPYCGITNYYYDQWLRLWMLGGPAQPMQMEGRSRGKFIDKVAYRELLRKVFQDCAKIMDEKACIYVRTDARPFTLRTTRDTLREAFPNKALEMLPSPFRRSTQTALFGDKEKKPGEVDIILR